MLILSKISYLLRAVTIWLLHSFFKKEQTFLNLFICKYGKPQSKILNKKERFSGLNFSNIFGLLLSDTCEPIQRLVVWIFIALLSVPAENLNMLLIASLSSPIFLIHLNIEMYLTFPWKPKNTIFFILPWKKKKELPNNF